MLFSDERRHSLSIPAVNKDGKPANIAFLIDYLCENTMKDTRKELFVLDGHLYVLESHHIPGSPSFSISCVLAHHLQSHRCLSTSYSHPNARGKPCKMRRRIATPSRISPNPISHASCESGATLTRSFSSRPGILALINDADWELEGEEAYEVQSGDNILFVSTLHGG